MQQLPRVIGQGFAATSALLLASRQKDCVWLEKSATESAIPKVKVAIVGATGAVGEEIIDVLFRRQFPLADLRLFASKNSAGKQVTTPWGHVLPIEEFSVEKAREVDVVFMATTATHALKYAPLITAEASGKKGPLVIDNSKAFRYMEDVPLVVPEVNGDDATKAINRGGTGTGGGRIIANPNCTTAIAAMCLWPLHCTFGLEEVIVSSYQAASGAGVKGMEELAEGSWSVLATGEPPPCSTFAHPLPFNVIPHIDKFLENGYTLEEMKVAWETRKIFGITDPSACRISVTAVRTPTMRAHAEAITVKTTRRTSPEEARAVLNKAKGVRVLDDPSSGVYPMPLNSTRQDDVSVGRIRQSLVHGDRGLDLFVCGDQLLRGAALNAVLIAEHVLCK